MCTSATLDTRYDHTKEISPTAQMLRWTLSIICFRSLRSFTFGWSTCSPIDPEHCCTFSSVKMLVEDQRFLHEDLERLEQGVTDRVAEGPRNVSRIKFHIPGRVLMFSRSKTG